MHIVLCDYWFRLKLPNFLLRSLKPHMIHEELLKQARGLGFLQNHLYDTVSSLLLKTGHTFLKKNPLLPIAQRYLLYLLSSRYEYLFTVSSVEWLVVTDFESFGARRAFPCFDEPKYKATFQLTSIISEALANDGYVSRFNTEVEGEITNSGFVETSFKITPMPLSTYLVAFVISDFENSPEPSYFNSSFSSTENLKPFTTVGRSKFFEPRQDLLSQVAGPPVLEYITGKTKVGFGFEKVEQAGIPDFAAGAMENWGLVTYREGLLFYDNRTGSTYQKQQVVTVIAHELGHQWFGNLVTLHWWSDLWLNEGFAAFYEYHAADQIRVPTLNTSDWDLIGQFVESVMLRSALPIDSFVDSRPLTSEAYDQDTIDNFFDSISYDKGGAILRMWRHILGEDIFYAGLQYYLTSNAQSTGTPEDLLSSFNKAVEESVIQLPKDVTTLFQGWHQQAGFPLITVSRNNSQLKISQKQFLVDGSEGGSLWNVPITYSTDLENNFEETQPVAFLLESDAELIIELKNESAAWVVLNNQATGYYRINYDDENWDILLDILDDPNSTSYIHDYNRAQILDDYFNLSGFLIEDPPSIGRLLRMLQTLKHQRSLVVWKSGLNIMNYLLSQLSSHPDTYSLLKVYLSEIVAPVFDDLGLNVEHDEPHSYKLLRLYIGKMACKLGIDSCRKQIQELQDKTEISPDIREIVFCESIKKGGSQVWEATLHRAVNEESGLRKDLLSSLLCITEESLFERLVMDSRLTGGDKQDLILAASLGDNNRAMLALRALSKQKLRLNQFWSKVLNNLARVLNTDEAAQLMEPISKVHSKMIRLNRRWLDNKHNEILSWLQTNL